MTVAFPEYLHFCSVIVNHKIKYKGKIFNHRVLTGAGIAPVSLYSFGFLYLVGYSISSLFLYLPGSPVCEDPGE